MKTIFLILYSSTIILCGKVTSAVPDTSAVDFYNLGNKALTKQDTAVAEYYFKNSIDKDKTAPALFELSKILINKKTIRGRAAARELLQSAIFKEPENIKYRLLMAALMEYFSNGLAFKVYENILEIDSTNNIALFQLGRIKEDDFNEFHHSVFQDDPFSPILSLDKFAMEDFEEAEQYFLKILYHDSTNSQAIFHISTLYEDAGKPEKAVPLLERLVKLNQDDEKAHLYLGLMYYKTSNLLGAYNQYKEALTLMKPAERRDFTYYSVKELIKPLLGDQIKNFNEIEIENLINTYWKVKDPLYLTDYNERLLEHYSRVAYADLHFSTKKNEDAGWKSDRGEVVLRYGEPLNRIRFRPQISVGSHITIKSKTDVWYYTDMVFGFSDSFFNGDFQFVQQPLGDSRIVSQYNGDSFSYYKYVKRVRNETYDPKFEGPKFTVPYEIAQFKDLNDKNGYTDVYVNYGLKFVDSLSNSNNYLYSHNTGLFFFDQLFRTISVKRDSIPSLPIANRIEINDTSDYIVNSLMISVPPDSGNFAFEIKRNADKGISSNHFKLTVRKFNHTHLEMSDIVLADEISDTNSSQYPFTRGNINILPNPVSTFTDKNNIFIYYEIYNLTLDENNSRSVEQTLTIKKIEDRSAIRKVFNSILNIFGSGKDEQQITLTTQYQFHTKNPQVYFQLDMSKYEPGNYILNVKIKDNISGKETEQQTELTWK